MHRSDQYNDTRYNGSRIAYSIPSVRSSVFHTRELSPDPLKPPSFVSPNGIPPPLAFRVASECDDMRWARLDYGLAIERTEPIYRDPQPGCALGLTLDLLVRLCSVTHMWFLVRLFVRRLAIIWLLSVVDSCLCRVLGTLGAPPFIRINISATTENETQKIKQRATD